MALQATISAERLRRKIGRTLAVLVDAIDEEGTAIARSTADAPEIDGVVNVANGANLPVGELAEVRILDTDEHDLYAEVAVVKETKNKPRGNEKQTPPERWRSGQAPLVTSYLE